MNLTVKDIKTLKRNEKLILCYKTVLPQHLLDAQYSNPLVNPKLKPKNHEEEATVISAGKKTLKIQLSTGRVLVYDYGDFKSNGSRGVDSQFYMVMKRKE